MEREETEPTVVFGLPNGPGFSRAVRDAMMATWKAGRQRTASAATQKLGGRPVGCVDACRPQASSERLTAPPAAKPEVSANGYEQRREQLIMAIRIGCRI